MRVAVQPRFETFIGKRAKQMPVQRVIVMSQKIECGRDASLAVDIGYAPHKGVPFVVVNIVRQAYDRPFVPPRPMPDALQRGGNFPVFIEIEGVHDLQTA